MKHLNTYENDSFNSKSLTSYITEYIVKKKLNEPIDSEHNYKYFPNSKDELINIIDKLLDKEISNFNCINTSKIRNMSLLFFYRRFNRKQKSILKDINISEWDVSNVENMGCMFGNCEKFDCDVSNWNIRNVIYMDYAFINCLSFTGKGLDKWNPQSLKDSEGIFDNCKSIKKYPKWYTHWFK